jgi:death-on-curing protein
VNEYCLSLDALIRINFDHTGNHGRVADKTVLESSLANPLQTFDATDLYPTVIEKAAVLLHGLATTQGFVDGNKRTAWLACVTFLGFHDIRLTPEADDYAADVVLEVVAGTMPRADLQEWILNHIEDSYLATW